MLKPFFCYYGGKWRVALKYPPPRYDHIIEPFAGAAGYATRYASRKVTLCDLDPKICGVWEYLIKTKRSEILRLPLVVNHVDELKVCQEAKWLIGFWLNKGASQPCLSPSAWMRGGTRPNSYWGVVIRNRIANQVGRIRHWGVINRTFSQIDNKRATWFVDPPYCGRSGRLYPHNTINYQELGDWCRGRDGQTIVCEVEGANWLPFTTFRTILANQAKGKYSHEVVWTNGGGGARCLWE